MYLFGRHTRTRPSRRPRLEVEAVEGRQLLSTLFVSTTGSFKGLPAFTSIQGAVNAAKPGDTIDVAAGTYHENVVIGKTLSLLGAQAGVNPITGLRTNPAKESTVNRITIQSTANVRIDGFSLNDPGGVPLVDQLNHADTIANNIVLPGADEGVLLFEGDQTTLIDNEIETTLSGDGIGVVGSKSASLNDTIQGNEVINPGLNGIELFGAIGVVVKGNSVSGSKGDGLNVVQSTDINAANNLLVTNNVGANFSKSAFDTFKKNNVEFNRFEGIFAVGDQADVILANSVFGNATSGVGSAIILDNVSGGEAVENNSVLQNHSNGIEVFSTSAKGVKVTGNTVEGNGGDGVGLGGTSNIIVAANVLKNNAVGIHLVSSSSNRMIGNVADNNRSVGILLDAKSAGNTVTENTALGNGVFDAEDLSTGTGTAGTANLWTRNRFNRDNRGGGLGH